MTATATLVTCDARTGELPGDYGMTPLWCNAAVGLTTYTDKYGTDRRYCRHHMSAVLYRYPALETIEPCAICHDLTPILEGIYTRVTFGGDVVNLCDICREKGEESPADDEDEYDHNLEGDPTRNGAFG